MSGNGRGPGLFESEIVFSLKFLGTVFKVGLFVKLSPGVARFGFGRLNLGSNFFDIFGRRSNNFVVRRDMLFRSVDPATVEDVA